MSSPWRDLFPSLSAAARHAPAPIYLDSAATTQKPASVIAAELDYYTSTNANVQRGHYLLSHRSEEVVGRVRRQVADFIDAASPAEVVFIPGTTAGLNLLARSYGECLQPGEEVIVSQLAHHSHWLPWQLLCQQRAARLKVAPMRPGGLLDLEQLAAMLSPRTRIVAVELTSNVLGVTQPIAEICALAHPYGAAVVVDATQAPAHRQLSVRQLGCDFLLFSAHKMYGPTGVGVLYGREERLASMPPLQLGGGMVEQLSMEQPRYAPLPYRHEAGTLPLAQIAGLGAAIDFLAGVGYEAIAAHEARLREAMLAALADVPGLGWVGGEPPPGAIFSFSLPPYHPEDIGIWLDLAGMAVRTGHFCAQPLMAALGLPQGAVRASLALYNSLEEVDIFCKAVRAIASGKRTGLRE